MLEAAEVAVQDVQGHLHGGPVVGLGQHLEVNLRVLVPGEPEEADLALLLGLEGVLECSSRLEDPLGVVVVVDLVELPEVEVIGLEPAQAVFEVGLGVLGGPAAALGHEEDLVAPAPLRDRLAHPVLGLPVHVIPGVVEERDPFIDGALDQTDGILLVLRHRGVEPAQADHGDLLAGPAKRPERDAACTLVLGRLDLRRERPHGQSRGTGLEERASIEIRGWLGHGCLPKIREPQDKTIPR